MTKEEKCRTTQVGRIVIHKGDNEKRVYENELEKYYQDGWQKGVSDKHRKNNGEKHIGHIPWNKGIKKATSDHNSGVWQKGHIPWNKGLKGAQTARCKGLTKETSDSLKKTSISKTIAWSKVSKEERERMVDQMFKTKKERHTENTSNPEKIFYKELCKIFGEWDVVRQYKNKKKYPWHCDFYIKSKNLFIELNLHWTHGDMIYNPNNKECQERLEQWKEKAKVSKFYQASIENWTIRDLNKIQKAIDNNLHYMLIYKHGVNYCYNVDEKLKNIILHINIR